MKYTIFLLLLFLLASCNQRDVENFNQKDQYSKKIYTIEIYSGGQLIKKYDKLKTMVQNQYASDGYYFRDEEGKLIEVSADIIITCEGC
jgi:hypothetical protein